jgi:hypothetical protein
VGQLCVALAGCVTVMPRYVMDRYVGGWWVNALGRQQITNIGTPVAMQSLLDLLIVCTRGLPALTVPCYRCVAWGMLPVDLQFSMAELT